MVRRWWVNLREALEAGIRQRVTRVGLVFTIAILLVALAAFASANNLLFLLLATMLATLLISGFISRLSLAGLELDFTVPEHISARRKVAARLMLHNEKRWMPSFSIHLTGVPPSAFSSTIYFPVIPGGARVAETVTVSFGRRGAYRENGFQFSSRFPFGFTERRAWVNLRRNILVYPCLDPQPGFEELLATTSGELQSRQRGRSGDFYRIRPYEPLESARHVDWKATAHTGELQVREFAREQEPLLEILLDLAVPQRETVWFERAVDCCAFLAWSAAQREARVRFRTQEFDVFVPAEDEIYTVLKYLALAEPKNRKEFPAPGEDPSVQVVFTARPELVAESEWAGALVVEPATFPEPRRGGFGAGGPGTRR